MRKKLLKFSFILTTILTIIFAIILGSCVDRDNKNKKYTGFDIEMAKAVTNNLGVKLHPQIIVWKNKILDLESGNIDAIWNGMTYNNEYNKSMYQSQAYLGNKQTIVVSNNFSGELTINRLKEGKVALEIGSAANQLVEKYNASNSKISVEESQSQAEALQKVRSGIATFAMVDSLYAGDVINREGSPYKNVLKILDAPQELNVEEEKYVIGFKKDTKGRALQYLVEKEYYKLQQEGYVDKMLKKFNISEGLKILMKEPDLSEMGITEKDVESALISIRQKGLVIGITLYSPIAMEA